MLKEYDYLKSKIKEYPNTSSKMVNSYINLFRKLLKNKTKLVSNRDFFSSPLLLFQNFIFYLLNFKKILKKLLKNFKNIK